MKVKRHGTWEELTALIEPKPAAVPEPAGAKVAPPVKPSAMPVAPAAVSAAPVRTAPAAVATVAVAAKKPLSAGAQKVLENLKNSPKSRPKKRKTLVSHANSWLLKKATAADGEAAVKELLKAGKLKIDEKGAVEYRV